MATEVAAVRAAPPTPAAPRRSAVDGTKYHRRLNGLDWLYRFDQIDRRQFDILQRYGKLYRLASIEDGAALKSSLDIDGAFGGGKGGGLPKGADYSWMINEARLRLDRARSVLGFRTAMVLACDMVAGRQFTCREICPQQREADQIVNTLQNAADLLLENWSD